MKSDVFESPDDDYLDDEYEHVTEITSYDKGSRRTKMREIKSENRKQSEAVRDAMRKKVKERLDQMD